MNPQDLPRHPRTGLRALGFTSRGPVWPALGGSTPPEPPPAGDPDQPEKTFSQAELDRIVQREKAGAARSAASQLAESLGMSVEDAKQLLGEHAALLDAQKTQAQRDADALAAARADADRAKSEAATARHAAAVERELIRAGLALPDDAAERDEALTQAAALVTVDAGADGVAVAAAVKAAKKRWPGLFAVPAKAGSGDPGPGPRGGGKGGPTGLEAGRVAARTAAGQRGGTPRIENGRIVFDKAG